MTFSEQELNDLQKENERMKNDLQNLIDLYNQKKDEHQEKCKGLQEQYNEKQ